MIVMFLKKMCTSVKVLKAYSSIRNKILFKSIHNIVLNNFEIEYLKSNPKSQKVFGLLPKSTFEKDNCMTENTK